jgi:hypothetical protein
VHSVLRRLASSFVLFGPLAIAGVTSGAPRVPLPPPREARAFTATELPVERTEEARAESAVVLVVLDGVRWQEVFEGVDRVLARRQGLKVASARDLMPNLHRLVDGEGLALGAPGHGGEITASGPQFISMPGYIEIFTGKPDPGCRRNNCAPAPARTVVDQVREASGPDDVEVVSSWPNIARAASADSGFALTAGRNLVNREADLRSDAPTAHLLALGAAASAWPGEGNYRPDSITSQLALRRLAVAQPRFLFVGLGDADEYAHHGDYRGYLEALRASDAFLGELSSVLGTMGPRGRHTTVLVTADHGRARDFVNHGRQFPESGRVWLVAAGPDVAGRGMVAAARRHTLSDLAPTIRALLGISEGQGPPIPEIVASAP